jgi:hypothetical protein
VIRPSIVLLLVVALVLGVTIGKRMSTPVTERQVVSANQGEAVSPKPPRVSRSPAMPSYEEALAQRKQSRKAMNAEQERRGLALHQSLSSRYAGEKKDAAWASAKESRLLAASTSDEIRRVGAEARNYTASCRSSVCRISADFPTRGALEDWLTLFSTGLGSELPNEAYVVSTNQDGSLRLEIMGLARK